MRKRNLQIDGLRGIAMIMIVAYHLFFRYGELFEGRTVSHAVEAMLPGVAVPTFLLISSMFLLHAYQERGGVRAFVSRCLSLFFHKVRRLWPAYAIAVTIIALFRLIIDLPGRGELSFGNYLCNLLMINGFIGVDYIDSAHWYITTLLSATAVTAIISCGIARRRVEACTCWVLISMVLYFIKRMVGGTLGRALSAAFVCIGGQYVSVIVAGILLGIIISGMERPKWPHWVCAVTCVVHILILRSTDNLLCIGIALLVVVAAGLQRLEFLRARPLVALGAISYEVYLIHQNISFGLIRMLTHSGVPKGVSACFAFVCSLTIGAILHRFVNNSDDAC